MVVVCEVPYHTDGIEHLLWVEEVMLVWHSTTFKGMGYAIIGQIRRRWLSWNFSLWVYAWTWWSLVWSLRSRHIKHGRSGVAVASSRSQSRRFCCWMSRSFTWWAGQKVPTSFFVFLFFFCFVFFLRKSSRWWGMIGPDLTYLKMTACLRIF